MPTSSFSAINLSNSLSERSLRMTFIFPNNSQDPLQIEGIRTEVFILKAGQEVGSTAKIKLQALDFEKILQMLKGNSSPLSQTPLMLALSGAEVKIEAGDNTSFLSLLFHGKIRTCHANFRPPYRFFEITAHSNLLYNDRVNVALSYERPVWASQILKALCAPQKIALENNDFDYLVQPPFSLHGTLLQQASQIINAQNGFFHFDPLQNKLSIAKEAFAAQEEPLILDEKDLIGFPYCSDQLLSVRCLFQNNLQLGQTISVQATEIENENIYLNRQNQIIPPWNGPWVIHALSHVLSTEKSGSKWETHLRAYRLSS